MGQIEAETEVTQVDAEITDAGCANYSFADPTAEGTALVEIAEDRAPGSVGWVEFINSQRSEAPGAGPGAPAVDAPADCAAAVAFVDDLLTAGKTIATLSPDESATLGQVFTVISEGCTPEEVEAFFARPDVTAFLGG